MLFFFFFFCQEDQPTNAVFLTSKYGQQYQCSFPDNYEADKQKEEAEKVAMETGIPDLLKPMETSPCLQMVSCMSQYGM